MRPRAVSTTEGAYMLRSISGVIMDPKTCTAESHKTLVIRDWNGSNTNNNGKGGLGTLKEPIIADHGPSLGGPWGGLGRHLINPIEKSTLR
jgi:hypothetical protein